MNLIDEIPVNTAVSYSRTRTMFIGIFLFGMITAFLLQILFSNHIIPERKNDAFRRYWHMYTVICILIGSVIGGTLGVVAMCLLQITRCSDCPLRMKKISKDGR
jgi:hypothetical protein